METLARKIKREETLNLDDYKYWVAYNFLAFTEGDQLKIKELNERQNWLWRRLSFLIPPFWCGAFALYKH